MSINYILSNMGPKAAAAVPYLAEALGNNDDEIAYKASSLSRIGSAVEPALDALITALQHNVPEHHWNGPKPGYSTTITPTFVCSVSGSPQVIANAGVTIISNSDIIIKKTPKLTFLILFDSITILHPAFSCKHRVATCI